MIQFHLNEKQCEFIVRWLAENKERPELPAYERACRAVGKVPVVGRPTIKSIPNTRAGFHANQLVPSSKFDAIRDLPEGWAILSDYDSGGNHRLHNAGGALLTALWNAWSCKPGWLLKLENGVIAENLNEQLLANGINFKERHG